MRKGDCVDATGGRIRKGLTMAQIARGHDAIPNDDVDAVLQRLAGDLGTLRRVFEW